MIDAARNPVDSVAEASVGLQSHRLVQWLGRVTRENAAPGAVFLSTRLVLGLLGFASSRILAAPRIRGNASVLPRPDVLAHLGSWTSGWFRFDAYWYVNVAEHGYHWAAAGRANTNFLPLYPLLIRGLQPFTANSPWVAAWLLSNAFSLVALVLLWHWARHRWDQQVALRVIVLTAFFPFAFFFAAPYAESLFLTLVLAAFLFAEKDQWRAAAIAAALAVLARPAGPALVAALFALAWSRRSREGMILSAVSVLPFVVFAAYVGLLTGHPFALANDHSAGWVAPHGGILTTLGSQFHTKLSPFDRVDAFVSVLFLLSTILVWKRFGTQYAVYVAGGTLLPLLRGLAGMERYVVVLFPVMAVWALSKSKLLQALLFAVSLAALVLFTSMFTAGYTLT